jgi:cob(I)alamin adenosyltransferase
MLYTRKGDDGKTKTFSCDQRISKSSAVAEALGTLDEINAYLGLCKVQAGEIKKGHFLEIQGRSLAEIIHAVQENLFIIQAEVAGASMAINADKVREIEEMVDAIEKELPPIKSFFISGGTELTAHFDIARTIARRAERRVIEASESFFAKASKDKGKIVEVSAETKAYLNRLSSLLYALARLTNHKFGIKEESPDYK